VAEAMARGALAQSATDVAVAVTGIAGPDGGSADKPVGLVWFGLAAAGTPTTTDHEVFKGDRAAVRHQATEKALTLLLDGLNRLK
jgi:nicotinamide-nucleotide amidase